MANLFAAIVTGALGLAYIVYGRRQTRYVAMIAGVLLCAISYFVTNWVWLSIISVVLAAAPFVIDL